MPGTDIPVVRVTGAAILDGTSAADAEQRHRRFFSLMDRDKDDVISGEEVPVGTAGNGSDPFAPTRSSTSQWMNAVDQNKDNRVDWKEFSEHFLPLAAIGRCQRGITD